MIDIFKISPMGEILLNYFGEGVIVFKCSNIHKEKQAKIARYLINRFSDNPNLNLLDQNIENGNNEFKYLVLAIYQDKKDMFSFIIKDEADKNIAKILQNENIIDIKYDLNNKKWKPIHYGECSYISLNEFIKNHVEFL